MPELAHETTHDAAPEAPPETPPDVAPGTPPATLRKTPPDAAPETSKAKRSGLLGALAAGVVCLGALLVALVLLPQPWQQSAMIDLPDPKVPLAAPGGAGGSDSASAGGASALGGAGGVGDGGALDEATTDCLIVMVTCPGWKAGDIEPLVVIERMGGETRTVAVTCGQPMDAAELAPGSYRISLAAPILADGTLFEPVAGYYLTIGKPQDGAYLHSFVLTPLQDAQMTTAALDEAMATLGITLDAAASQAAKKRIEAASAAGGGDAAAGAGNGGAGGSGVGGGNGTGGGGGSSNGGGSSGGSGNGGGGSGGNGGGVGGGTVTPPEPPPPSQPVLVYDYYCRCGAWFGSEEEVKAHLAYISSQFREGLITVEEARVHSGWYTGYHYE